MESMRSCCRRQQVISEGNQEQPKKKISSECSLLASTILTPVGLLIATICIGYIAHGTKHKAVTEIAVSSVILGIMTVAAGVAICPSFVSQLKKKKNEDVKENNLNQEKTIEERLLDEKNTKKREDLIQTLSVDRVDSIIRQMESELQVLVEESQETMKKRVEYKRLIAQLLGNASPTVVTERIATLSYSERLYVYEKQLQRENISKEALFLNMVADVKEFRKDNKGDLNEKEYKKQFIAYAKEVSFENFLKYYGKESLYTTQEHGGAGAFTVEELQEALDIHVKLILVAAAPEQVEDFALFAYEYSKGLPANTPYLKLYQEKYIDCTLTRVSPVFIAKQEEGCYSHKTDGLLSLAHRYQQLLDKRLNVVTRINILYAVGEKRRQEILAEFMKSNNRDLLGLEEDLKTVIYEKMSLEELVIFVQRLKVTEERDVELIVRVILRKNALKEALDQFETKNAETAGSAILVGKLMNLLINERKGSSMGVIETYLPYVVETYQKKCIEQLASNQFVEKRVNKFSNKWLKPAVEMKGKDGEVVAKDTAKLVRQTTRAINADKKLTRTKTEQAQASTKESKKPDTNNKRFGIFSRTKKQSTPVPNTQPRIVTSSV